MSKSMTHVRAVVCVLALALSVLMFALSGAVLAAQDFAVNPGFEEENPSSPGDPLGWRCVTNLAQAECDWVDDTVHSGQKAVRVSLASYAPPNGDWAQVTFTNDAVSWQSLDMPAPPPGSVVDVSGWVKAEDVVAGQGQNWYRMRFSFAFYNGSTRLQNTDIVAMDGTFDWQQVSRRFTVPANATSTRITVSLTAATGTVWLDDVSIALVE